MQTLVLRNDTQLPDGITLKRKGVLLSEKRLKSQWKLGTWCLLTEEVYCWFYLSLHVTLKLSSLWTIDLSKQVWNANSFASEWKILANHLQQRSLFSLILYYKCVASHMKVSCNSLCKHILQLFPFVQMSFSLKFSEWHVFHYTLPKKLLTIPTWYFFNYF